MWRHIVEFQKGGVHTHFIQEAQYYCTALYLFQFFYRLSVLLFVLILRFWKKFLGNVRDIDQRVATVVICYLMFRIVLAFCRAAETLLPGTTE